MRKITLRVLISAILTAAIVCSLSVGCFAAVNQTKYIADLRVCAADSPEEAEKELTSMGYKLLSTKDINATLEDGIYLGYKTTLNPAEAITDIGVMNMLGNYSFSDYETLMEQQEENVRQTIASIIPMIVAYRANYNDARPLALEAYNVLNKFYEDDSMKAMGDYLLSCDLENTDDLTKVFMQGYTPTIIDIKQMLFLAGTKNENWLERMAEGYSDDVLETYLDSYSTPNKAYKALAKDYGDKAQWLISTWDSFYEQLQNTTDAYFTEEEDNYYVLNEEIAEAQLTVSAEDESALTGDMQTEEEAEAYVDSLETVLAAREDAKLINLVQYLNGMEYDDSTMLTFFMRPSDDVLDTELYNVAYYMGNNLASQLLSVNLGGIMERLLMSDENMTMDAFKEINESFADHEQLSVYDGVDRTLFTDGVALTGSAVTKNMSSQKSWSDNLMGRVFRTTDEYAERDNFVLFTVPMIAAAAGSVVIVAIDSVVRHFTSKMLRLIASNTIRQPSMAIKMIYTNYYEQTGWSFNLLKYLFGCNDPLREVFWYNLFFYVRTAFIFATVIIGIVAVIRQLMPHAPDEPEPYLTVPSHLVDVVKTENGDDYVAYTPIKNTLESAGDLNNYKGQNGWLMLYYTKDPEAGRPLTTDIKIIVGSDEAPAGFTPVRKFGSTDAANLTDKEYTGLDDKAGGTYIYFTREQNLFAGSSFSGGYAAISVFIGALAGLLAGVLSAKAVGSKSKRKEPSAA